MKSVLISVRPEWCRKIATGEKTIEVRKTAPNLATPYKGYLYCTLSGCNEFFRDVLRGDVAAWNRENWSLRKGRVWAEFICDADLPLLFYAGTGKIQGEKDRRGIHALIRLLEQEV